MNDHNTENTEDLPDIRYAHPSHAEFNARLAAQNEPTPRDVTAPWSPSEKLPNLRRDFAQLFAYLQPREQSKEQDNQEQGKSQMVEEDRLAPTYVPPPHIRDAVHRESFGQRWMLEHRNTVMTQAVIPQRGQHRDHNLQQSNHHSGEPPMSNNAQNQHNPNAPLETFKDGAVTVKLWQQEARSGEIFVNASVGRLYKDRQSGQWKESRTMSFDQLAALQNIIPKALEMAHVHEVALNAQRQEHIRAQVQMQQQPAPAPAQHVSVQQPAQSTPTQSSITQAQNQPQAQNHAQPLVAQTAQQVLSQQDIVAQRDAVVSQSQPAQSQSPQHTQEHAHTQTHEPSR